MEPIHINCTLAAFIYALAASISKQALSKGVGVLRLSFVINLIFVPVFACVLLRHEGTVPWSQIGYPIATGVLFFMGQIFTFMAIRMGEVSLQTCMMGTKAVFVVMIAGFFGLQTISVPMMIAAVVSMLAVALLGFSGFGSKRLGLTLLLALLSSAFYACSDVMVGTFGGDFGPPAFLFITMLVNGILAFGLIPFFNAPLREVPRDVWKWAIIAGLMMAGQALLLNYSLARYSDVAVANILYSTRGLWSVLIGLVVLRFFSRGADAWTPLQRNLRLTGALLMSVAIAILFI